MTFVLPTFQTSSPQTDHTISLPRAYLTCSYPECSKTFKYKSELDRHEAIHKNERPFVCSFNGCSKSFKREDALKTHMRIHTHEKLFECKHEGCGASFTNRASLRYHELKHREVKDFVCSFPGCNKAFYTKFQLNQHLRSVNAHRGIEFKRTHNQEFECNVIHPQCDSYEATS